MNSLELFKLTQDDETSSNIDVSEEDVEVLGTSGLINQGNTCYMNSIIQCLSNCEPFRNLIIGKNLVPNLIDSNSNIFIEKSKLESNLSFQLRKIFINIWNSSFYSFRPISFRKLFGKKIEQFQNSNQQDSQEALLCILDSINDELAMNVQISPVNKNMIYDCLVNLHKNEDANQHQILQIIKSNLSDYLNYKSINDYIRSHKKYSPINSIFEGRTISQLTCSETQGIKTNFESFFYFTLALPQDKYEDVTESETSSASKSSNKSKASTSSNKSPSEFWCKLCKKDLQSSKCYDEHILGRKHKNNEKFHIEVTSSINSDDIYEYESESNLSDSKNETANDSATSHHSDKDETIHDNASSHHSDKDETVHNSANSHHNDKDETVHDSATSHHSDSKNENSDSEDDYEYSDDDDNMDEDDEDDEDDDNDSDDDEDNDNDSDDDDSDDDDDDDDEDDEDNDSDNDSDTITSSYNNFDTLNLFQRYNFVVKKKVLKKFTLYDLLDNHIVPEKLENDNKWFSPYANKLVDAEKCNLIWESPKILIILLKRFEYTYTGATKLNNIIDFPFEDLDITPYLHPNHTSKYTKYDLFAINNHTNFSNFGFNGISFGHYYSYCKNYTNNKWYNYDDANVTEIDEKDLITKHAYMLFYKARE